MRFRRSSKRWMIYTEFRFMFSCYWEYLVGHELTYVFVLFLTYMFFFANVCKHFCPDWQRNTAFAANLFFLSNPLWICTDQRLILTTSHRVYDIFIIPRSTLHLFRPFSYAAAKPWPVWEFLIQRHFLRFKRKSSVYLHNIDSFKNNNMEN